MAELPTKFMSSRQRAYCPTLSFDGDRPGRPGSRSHLWLRHHCLRRRTMGPPWITIDTSRVALALARARIMGARYPYYLLADSSDGQLKEAEVTRSAPSRQPTHGNIRQGFVYERVPHITLKSIANNAEIDVIWEKLQSDLEPLREELNKALQESGKNGKFRARQMRSGRPRRRSCMPTGGSAHRAPEGDRRLDRRQGGLRVPLRQALRRQEKVRVAGPFTVESLSPHRVLAVDENDELIDGVAESDRRLRRGARASPR